jgi:hypothetical protein
MLRYDNQPAITKIRLAWVRIAPRIVLCRSAGDRLLDELVAAGLSTVERSDRQVAPSSQGPNSKPSRCGAASASGLLAGRGVTGAACHASSIDNTASAAHSDGRPAAGCSIASACAQP